MKLPSGIELTPKRLADLFDRAVRYKVEEEGSFADAFYTIAEELGDGEIDGIPALPSADVEAIRAMLGGPVIDCTQLVENIIMEQAEKFRKEVESRS